MTEKGGKARRLLEEKVRIAEGELEQLERLEKELKEAEAMLAAVKAKRLEKESGDSDG